MKSELEEKLLNEYPKILDRKNLLDGGIACGDGWYMLLDKLCSHLQFNTDHNNGKEQGNEGRYPQVVAVQVKEKFGGLRFYVNSCCDYQHGAISFAESMSFNICETCGSTDEVELIDGGWYRSLCKKCRGDAPLLKDRQFSEKVLKSKLFKVNREENNQ